MADTKKVSIKVPTKLKRNILFADYSALKYTAVVNALTKEGIESETVTSVEALNDRVSEDFFDLVVVNLLLGGMGPFEMIKSVRKVSNNREIRIIVVTRQMQKVNLENTMHAGANDFIGEPFEALNLVNRIVYHLGSVREVSVKTFAKADVQVGDAKFFKLLLETSEILSRTPRDKTHDSIYKTLQALAPLVDSNRTSLIVVDESSNTGVVLASSDDPAFTNFPIRLDQYPEILHVLHSGHLIHVADVKQNVLTEAIQKNVRTISIGSLITVPVHYQNEIVGVLSVRRPSTKGLPSESELRILQAVANVMAAHSNAAVLLRRIYKDFNAKSGT